MFAMGDSVELEKIAKAIDQDTATTRKIIEGMMDHYRAKNRGIQIVELDGAFQLCTKSSLYEYLIRVAKQPKKITLSDVVMETLSIIAYKQPITKLEIEKIRGVKCDHAVNRLVEYDLVKELGRLDAPDARCCLARQKNFCAILACSLWRIFRSSIRYSWRTSRQRRKKKCSRSWMWRYSESRCFAKTNRKFSQAEREHIKRKRTRCFGGAWVCGQCRRDGRKYQP